MRSQRSRLLVSTLLIASLLIGGAVAASHAAATRATDAVLARYGTAPWTRRAFLVVLRSPRGQVPPFTWIVTYYQDFHAPQQAFCEPTQFTVSLRGRILRTWGDPAAWMACLGADTTNVGRGA